MRISEAALRFAVPRHHIDYWRRTGLLSSREPDLGFDDILKVRLISNLRKRGFTLQRIRSAVHRCVDRASWHRDLFLHETGRLLMRDGSGSPIEPESHQWFLSYMHDANGVVLPLANSPPDAAKADALPDVEKEYLNALSAEDPRAVRKAIRELLSNNPAHVGARIEAGNVAFEEGRLDEAIAHYEKALENEPNCVEAIYNSANIYFRQKKYAVAIRLFHRCIELDSEFPESYYNLAILYFSLQYYDHAITLFEVYIQMDPDSSWADQARQFIEDIRQAANKRENDLFSGDKGAHK